MKGNIFTLLLLLTPFLLSAQQDALLSQYMFNGLVLNPAYAGTHQYFTADAIYRRHWVKFDGAANTQILSVDGSTKNRKMGFGLLVSRDIIGVSKQNEFWGNYSYHFNFSSKVHLSMGLKAGGSIYSAKLSQLPVSGNNQTHLKDIHGEFLPNFGFGLYLYADHFFIGASIPQIIDYEPKTTFYVDKTDAQQIIRHYYLTAGYIFDENENLIFKPSFLLKYIANEPLEVDLNLNVLIYKRIWLGGSWRTENSFVSLLEIQATEKFRLGYAYDIPLNHLRKYEYGAHEIMLSYDFGLDVLKMKTPRYF